MEDGTVALWWVLAAFVAGGFMGVFVMSLMSIASFDSERDEIYGAGIARMGTPGADATADDWNA